MTYSQNDALTKMWLPAMRSMRPAGQVMQEKAVRRAITDDGYIDPIAILPGSTVIVDFASASTTDSSSDTVNYADYLSTTIHLPDGVWSLKAMGGLTGSLNGATTMNTQLTLNSGDGGNYQIPLASGEMATVFPRHVLDEVQGDVLLQVMFRPTAGTLTIEAGYWFYRAERLR
jgi:hypothetical protein